MNKSYPLGQALLWFIILYHALAGVLLMGSGDLAIRFASAALGWTIEGSPPLGVAGEMMGCYLIAFALMMALVSRDPVKHRSLLLVAMALIALRLGQRLYFADKVMDVFRVPESRYWMSCGFVLLLLLALAAFWRQLGRDASATAAA